jgi:hypothetical protein
VSAASAALVRRGDRLPARLPVALPVWIDRHGNIGAREGCDRCWCGCKYWEQDRCIDCGTHVGGRRDPGRHGRDGRS